MKKTELEALNNMSQEEEWGAKFTKYDVDVTKLTAEQLEAVKALNVATEPKLFLTAEEMKTLGIADSAIVFDGDSHFAKELLLEMLTKCVKNAKHYLVYKHHVTWDGQSTYEFCDSLEAVADVMASVEGGMFFRKVYNKGKGLKVTVYTHEIPNGHGFYVVALNDKEFKQYSEGVTFHDFKAVLNIG